MGIAAETMYRFLVRRPGVRISLLTLLNHEVLAAAREHRVDLGLGLAPASHSGVRAERLCQSDLVCIMPPDDQLTVVNRDTIPALAPFPLNPLDRHQPIDGLIDAAFRVAGHHQTIAVEVTQSASVPAMVRLGATVALINGFSVATTGMAGWVLRPFVPLAAIIGADATAARPAGIPSN